MRDYSSIRYVPKLPGVYCLLGYSAKGLYPAYVGIGSNLQTRVQQHLEYRNSSVTTGTSAASLDPVLIGGCRWWTDASFSEETRLKAAELVAFDLLKPVLRSRGSINKAAQELAAQADFRQWMADLTNGPASEVIFPNLTAVIKDLSALEKRIEVLEAAIRDLKGIGTPE